MNHRTIFIVIVIAALCGSLVWRVAASPLAPMQQDALAFATVDVVIETNGTPLAAYQLEIAATHASTRFVGIEGGDSAVFRDPPYYDPAAMQQERVIIADFSNAASDALPRGAVRIARLHVQYDPNQPLDFNSELIVAATRDGVTITDAALRVTPIAP